MYCCTRLLKLTAVPVKNMSSKPSPSAAAKRRPKAFVFDLDGCVWDPEMYELWGGGGAPFAATADGDLRDRAGTAVRLMGDVRAIMRELAADEQWRGTVVAIASRCDEPSWARECIKKFSLGGDMKLDDAFNGPREIHKGCKTGHLKNISKQTGIPLSEMVFFDDQYGNCTAVAGVGVTVVYTPRGLTRALFQESLDKFPSAKVLGPKQSGPSFW